MTQTPSVLSTLEYPGRLIALGASPDGARTVIIYAITGRSPSSQARRLVFRDGGVWVQPTDEEVLKKGNVELLVYPAILIRREGIAVSNGKQTGDILERLPAGRNPAAVLAEALERWDYEADSPIFTPRISGCVRGGRSGLSIIRRGPDGVALRSYFEIAARPSKAGLISTYGGPNRDPLPSFEGEPLELTVADFTAKETAESVYASLGPKDGEKDFRVAVACLFASPANPEELAFHIVNRQGRT